MQVGGYQVQDCASGSADCSVEQVLSQEASSIVGLRDEWTSATTEAAAAR